LRFWFGFSERVDRRRYFLHGAGLMLFKYLTDALVIYLVTGAFWTPVDYLLPVWSLRAQVIGASHLWLQWALVAWSLPFLWIGVSMTMRRAIDAGNTPWECLFFFVPGVNYLVMLILCLEPSVSRAPEAAAMPRPVDPRLVAALKSIAAGLAVAIPTVLISILFVKRYTGSLFLGTPFSLGAITAYVFNRGNVHTYRATLEVVLIALLLLSGAVLLFALEGIVCIAMAFPVAAIVAGLGAILGRAIAGASREPAYDGGGLALLVPLLGVLLPAGNAPVPLRQITTTIEIAAPPERVWPHVVAFTELPEPTEWLFKTGIAYPQRARIVGSGVGAVRYCEFSTGAFVEPITTWDAPRRLAFDVVSQPIPMRESSPYRHVYAAHLDTGFRARAGAFRLIALPNGHTRLEGSTWYQLDLLPRLYWSLYADGVVHAIHRRVLAHVKRLTEE
jgi:uncharacterized membrane protein YhaH (DUF805 family)